ncbi:MAG: LPS export ABC transporter periplasmic protein LptC [Pseudomonadota bacterium]
MVGKNSLPRPVDRSHEWRCSRRLRFWVTPVKFGFPVLATIILALVLFWPKVQELSGKKPKSGIQKTIHSKRVLENELQRPRMKSLNSKGRAYMVQAVNAVQANGEHAELSGKLNRPHGEMELDDGSLLEFWADKGNFSQQDNLLHLSGNVHITTSKGYDFRTQSADFDFVNNQGEGHEPVTGIGPTRENIEAQGFKITGKGDDIQFLGQTRLTLYTK